MKMRFLIKLRKAIKNPKSAQRLIQEIKGEISYNDRKYKERDKELKDLLKMIAATQDIVKEAETE